LVLKKLNEKMNEKTKNEERLEELIGKLKSEESKRMGLERIIDKFIRQRKNFKLVIDKLKDDVISYRQTCFEDLKKTKQLEKINKDLED